MNIFKKIFCKRKKEEEQKPECWYNDVPSQEKGIFLEPSDAMIGSPNSYTYTTAQQAAKHQG